MAQYQVPQFIEVEDKIFGPLTLKQFIYLAGGGGVCLIAFTLLPLVIALLVGLPIAAFSLSLAFYQVNGRPFLVAIEHAFSYFVGGKLYLWKQREAKPIVRVPKVATGEPTSLIVPKLTEGKLKDLAWSLNIKDQSLGGKEIENSGFRI